MELQLKEIACDLVSYRAPSVHFNARDATQAEAFPSGRVAQTAPFRNRQARNFSIIGLDTDSFQITNFEVADYVNAISSMKSCGSH